MVIELEPDEEVTVSDTVKVFIHNARHPKIPVSG